MGQPKQSHRPPLHSVLETHATVTTATYTAKAGDRILGVNRAGAVNVTLPSAQVRPGRTYTVKDESGAAATNNITVATEGSETIDGSATDVISDNYGAKTYYSDGTNWFEIPLLAPPAHSATTGQSTDDHHAETHGAAHASGGADAVKLDDLSSPDDNTDLDFSTSAHGLVPKGTNVGDFLKDDGSWATTGASSDISARAYNSANQSLADNTWVALGLNSERFDTDTIHDTSTNNSRLTCKTAGVYIITGSVKFAGNATGNRFVRILLNGTTAIAYNTKIAPGTTDTVFITVASIYKLSVNDYVELVVFQDSGGSLDHLALGNTAPEFAMAKVLG